MNLVHLFSSLSPMSIMVVLLLGVVSVYSWMVIFAKHRQWKLAQQADREFLKIYRSKQSTAEVLAKTKNMPASSLGAMFTLAEQELAKIKEQACDQDALAKHFKVFGLTGLQRSLQQGRNTSLGHLAQGLSGLATIGAVSPFVGLFGTVWGIISAFQGLASGGASLDAVAPGIAEALVATAVGLFAAIPAVCFYNFYQKKLDQQEQRLDTFALEFLNGFERSLLGKI